MVHVVHFWNHFHDIYYKNKALRVALQSETARCIIKPTYRINNVINYEPYKMAIMLNSYRNMLIITLSTYFIQSV